MIPYFSFFRTKEKLKQKEEELIKANQLIEKLLATNKGNKRKENESEKRKKKRGEGEREREVKRRREREVK